MNLQAKPAKNTPSLFVIFGVSGDLAAKKIIPSLWRLFQQNLLSDHFSVIGFARREFSKEGFKEFIHSALSSHAKDIAKSNGKLSRFIEFFSYQIGAFEDKAGFQSVAQAILTQEKSWGVCANKLFYVAVENLASVKLNLPCGGKLG